MTEQKSPPKKCPICGDRRELNGSNGSHFNRLGWYYYGCGRRWHATLGWSSTQDRCLERRFKAALYGIRRCSLSKMSIFAAGKALNWKRDLPKGTFNP